MDEEFKVYCWKLWIKCAIAEFSEQLLIREKDDKLFCAVAKENKNSRSYENHKFSLSPVHFAPFLRKSNSNSRLLSPSAAKVNSKSARLVSTDFLYEFLSDREQKGSVSTFFSTFYDIMSLNCIFHGIMRSQPMVLVTENVCSLLNYFHSQ